MLHRRLFVMFILSMLVACGGPADDPTATKSAAAKGDSPWSPNECVGAWVDLYGNCRGPADGVLPADCCDGQSCGPLSNIPCPIGYTCELDPDSPFQVGQCVKQQQNPCFGAWLDQSGNCRGPADGVLPTSCCAGQICGGVANLPCPADYECRLDATYPDASGKCVKKEKTCYVGGCSGQICSETAGLISTCEWLPHYGCYNLSQCGAHGENGACGWKKTPEFLQCLSQQGQ